MTAPHFHTTAEAKAAIKKVEHNSDSGNGKPTGIAGGSTGNMTTSTPRVEPMSQDADSVQKRGL